MKIPCVHLSHVAGLVLSLAVSGCCLGANGVDVYTFTDEETIMDEVLMEIRDSGSTDEERCSLACERIAYEARILSCEATGGNDTLDAWDPAQTEVTVTCDFEIREAEFCTGRRPIGHCEASAHPVSNDARAAHFAELAYLESASIHAFIELGEWLERNGAPADLIERCRAAADDEVEHAARMTEHARRGAVKVEPPRADPNPGGDDLLEVALHNAVEGCVNEAFGAVIAMHQARACDEPELRELFGRVATDELRHGQLAWDLHSWLMDRLDDAGRERVVVAQRAALAALSSSIRRSAARAPDGLGWPSPALAARMAERYAASISQLTAPVAA